MPFDSGSLTETRTSSHADVGFSHGDAGFFSRRRGLLLTLTWVFSHGDTENTEKSGERKRERE
jgi:hypothetical protein